MLSDLTLFVLNYFEMDFQHLMFVSLPKTAA